jgi:CheY-like chemotaxis protein
MSEAMTIPPLADAPAKRTPTVYFIDDSATMREVIKIAFRRESINIITCGDAAAALAQFAQNPPDAVITDVIMPDQDGYSVCTQIKQHPEFSSVPVILMSGVVNKTVADKAIAVKADELIRKPFQPQELIARVKTLLGPKFAAPPAPERHIGASSLQTLFAPPPPPQTIPAPPAQRAMPPAPPQMAPPENAWPRALAEAFTPRPLRARTSSNSKPKSPVSSSSSKSSRPNCKSSANTTKPSNNTSTTSPRLTNRVGS